MADTETELEIDGKSVYSLRVVDLKQELKKRDIPFKTNASKAQLQTLLVQQLSESIDTIEEDKSSEDNSRMTAHSEDTNETIESNPEANNVPIIEDIKQVEEQTEATDLSQDSGITSSVSFGDKHSIKLTIKLQPNDSPTKQLSPRMSPKKSPTKEMRSPARVEEVRIETITDDIPTKEEDTTQKEEIAKEQAVEQKVAEKSPQKEEMTKEEEVAEKSPQKEEMTKEEEVVEQKVAEKLPQKEETAKEEVVEQKVAEKLPQKEETAKEEEVVEQKVEEKSPQNEETVVKKPKQSISAEVLPKETESKEPIVANKYPKVLESSLDYKKLNKKSEEVNETKDLISEKDESNKTVVEDSIVISEEVSEDLIEQKTETSVLSSEKESMNSSQIKIVDKSEDSPISESIVERVDQKEEKTVEKENKCVESEAKEEKVKPPRRRRWGSSVTNDSQQNTRKGISSDQLKELIPDLDSADNSSTASKVSKSDSIVVTSSLSRTQTTEANHEMPPKRDIRVVRKSVSVAEEEQKNSTEEVVKSTPPNVEQKTKIVVQTDPESKIESEEKREVSPPRSAVSNVVFIRNLVRPFTLLQLKDVLGRTGKLIEERFWIDKIKSKCFATYETAEEAMATRLALHGTRWPASNPKLLSVDFAAKEDLDSHLSPELIKDLNSKKSDNEVNQKYDIVIRSEEQRNTLRDKENKTESRPIREWDRDKLVIKEDDRRNRRRPISPTHSKSQEKDIKRRRIGEERVRPADSTSEQEPVAEAVKRAESPAKLLDDLFRKTIATPSIYWLPLTEEQAVARLATKEEEEKKRAEERNAREEQFRKRQEERRPFDGPPPPFRNERNQWRTDSPPNRRNFGRRGSPPLRRSPPPGRRSPPRRRSPANRFSRSRSPIPRRKR